MDSEQRVRLVRLLGMLGSAHDGEVVNAARLAVRLIKGAGLDWHDVLSPDQVAVEAARVWLQENQQLRDEIEQLRDRLEHVGNRVPQTPASFRSPRSNGEKIETAIAWTRWLSDWEREFVTDIAGRPRLSIKQQDSLDQIIVKIERVARARGIAA
jgi:hypothetical protein